MKWTEPHKPDGIVSHYDYVECVTPIGTYRVEWKSWKEWPSFDIMLKDEWIGSGDSLEDAKEICEGHLQGIFEALIAFV